MEGLVLVILELVLPLAVLAGLVLVEGLALLAGLVQAVLPAVFKSGRTLFGRRLRRITLGAAAALGLAIILLQTVFFQPIVRRLAAAVQARAGIEVAFARASGNLLSGRVVLHDATARRASDPSAVFDVAVREMEVDVRLLSLLSGEVSIESVRVAGARGSYTRLMGGPERPPRKAYVVDVLLIEDAEIAWTLKRPDRPDFTLPVRVDRLEARPFSARDAAWSVLFRSECRGTVAESPFRIDRFGGASVWSLQRLPIRVMSDFLGEPFDWLSEGTGDFMARPLWREGDNADVDIHIQGFLNDPKAAVPERITGFRRKVSEGMVALINRTPRRQIPLDFTLTLKREGFMGSMSIESLELWDAVAAAAGVELGELIGVKPETGKKGVEWLKQRLKPKPSAPK